MYLKDNRYKCDFCGLELDWEESNDINGCIWECENCGKHFCSECFKKIVGEREYITMLSNDKTVCCDCYKDLRDFIKK